MTAGIAHGPPRTPASQPLTCGRRRVPHGKGPSLADAVDTGCNAGSGSVEITDTTLTFGPIATTRRSCIDELNALEASVLTVLQGAVTYEIDGDSLSLRSSEGDIGLELTAQR